MVGRKVQPFLTGLQVQLGQNIYMYTIEMGKAQSVNRKDAKESEITMWSCSVCVEGDMHLSFGALP